MWIVANFSLQTQNNRKILFCQVFLLLQVVKTALERYKEIQALCRASPDIIQSPIPVVSIFTKACGIEQVLISDIDLRDDPEYDYLICTLTLTEFDSIANQLLEQVQTQQQAEQAAEEADANMPSMSI